MEHTKKEIEYIMDEAGIPCGPVLDVKEAIEHPHTQAREMMVHCEHPTAGDLYFQGCVTKMSETPGVVETPSPLLGEHNRDLWINRRRRSTVKRRRRNLITFIS